ncbi:hypothetical protein [Oscillatoria sp. FACHB-1406]|uniref:hypothetical protein n=1 Tax=Oscillatoria sp. FACHB-1406 TaxID=2692846 RepID=UPI0016845DBB|nr:hypothetical protein [Oscillatoria sp. FACHB-1406]MBD2577219.1 hypothetical protein [Oscillatoria sp. FACHB-1406]
MNFNNDPERELKRLEQNLNKREQDLRLRELEAEINQNDSSKRTKPNSPAAQLQRLGKKTVNVVKFIFFTIVGVSLVYAVLVVGGLLIYLGIGSLIGWIVYQIFFKE